MSTANNEFFWRATREICSALDLPTAMRRCLMYLRTQMPADMMTVWINEESVCGLRTIAVATPQEDRYGDTIMLLPPDVWKKLLRMEVPHTVIMRAGLPDVTVRIVNRPSLDPVGSTLREYFEPQDYSAILLYLATEGNQLGTLFLRAEGMDRYTEEHAQLLALLAEPFALALSNALAREEAQRLKERIADDSLYRHQEMVRTFGDQIVGAEFGLKRVMDMVRQVVHLSTPVLLRGETGVGKDIIAGTIHSSSTFRNGPFIKVNCGAIPDTLMDSELFGHERGAFTGAVIQKRGYFERANHGTIFLDEIAELPPQAQVRLLRVLQYREVQRVGGSDPVSVDMRVIAATHRNLEAMVQTGHFREDLWFRLNVFPIVIPPLRHRKMDIPALVHHLIIRKARDLKLPKTPGLAPGSIDRLMMYHWPGNVRELENVIERALILSKGEDIAPDGLLTLETKVPHVEEESGRVSELDVAMADHIRKALNAANGRIHGTQGAAKLLGINASTLRNKMNKLGIPYGRRSRPNCRES